MRGGGAAAILLAMTIAGGAHARSFDPPDWLRHAGAWVRSLIDAPPADREVIAPPADIDPHMAIVPPATGTMRTIRPDTPPR